MQTTTTFIALLSLLSFTATAQQSPTQAPQSASANDFIEVFKKLSGEHPGVRKGHAKGVCALGSFEPSATAQARFDTPYSAIKRRLPYASQWVAAIQMPMRQRTPLAAWQWCLI